MKRRILMLAGVIVVALGATVFANVNQKPKTVNIQTTHVKQKENKAPANSTSPAQSGIKPVTQPPNSDIPTPTPYHPVIPGVTAPAVGGSASTAPVSANSGDKCYSNCTDPNRPSYDLWGNEWDYMGTLLYAACPNKPDPISGQNNPECVCPANTSEGTYYIQGYGKENQVVCGFSYYHECPYASAQPLDSPVCQKLMQEQQ